MNVPIQIIYAVIACCYVLLAFGAQRALIAGAIACAYLLIAISESIPK